MGSDRYPSSRTSRPSLIALFIVLVIGLGLGIVIGYFAISRTEDDGVFLDGVSDALVQEADPSVTGKIFGELSTQQIGEYLRNIADKPRNAGGEFEFEKAEYVYDTWKNNGADDVQLLPYQILLSFANNTNPSKVATISSSDSTVQFESQGMEDTTLLDTRYSLMAPILGFTPNGVAEGDLVYASYARDEEFDLLESKNINVTGTIVICRFGKGYRGDKVRVAEQRGAIGVIIYSDPADWLSSTDDTHFPDDVWLPPDGVQRGSAYRGDGDAQTPGYPATEFAYRDDEKNLRVPMPKIPAVPIGYADATELLKNMQGEEVPDTWRGDLNITYRFGPGIANRKVRVTSTNFYSKRTVYNVCGTIRGNVEPDRYVILGAHRDSWVFGGVDNGGGTATMMEIARAMMKLTKSGIWRPRRSLMFCSWTAEEYGLIGATEWIEEHTNILGHRALAYINMDCPMIGREKFRALGNPQVFKALHEATKKVDNPVKTEFDSGLKTVYDGWLAKSPEKDHVTGEELNIPKINKITSASDYGPFIMRAGIPAVDFRFTYDTKNLSFYSTYHSAYDTLELIEKYYDPGFEYHLAIAKLASELMRHMSDSLIIPFDMTDYAWQLRVFLHSLDEGYGELMRNHSVPFDNLKDAIANFTRVADEFKDALSRINKKDPLALRRINDQLMLLERSFVDSAGLPGRLYTRHLILASSNKNSYSGTSFPGLVDGMYKIGEDEARWEEVKKHLSVVVQAIRASAASLRDATKFMSDS